MSQGEAITLMNKALTTTLLLCMPLLGFGLTAGLIISVFQAATSIQEITLVFVPKILAVFLGLYLFGPWMLQIMLRFTAALLQSMWKYGSAVR